MMEAFELNVNAQDLINTAELFSESGSQVGTITSEMMNLVTGLNCVWSGDTAAAYMSKFEMLSDDIEKMLAMITEHVNDLEAMAENYQSGETAGESLTETLSTDVII